MDRETKDMTKNTGNEWKKIGDSGKEIHSQGITGTHS